MFIFFANLDLFCIDNARVIYQKIRVIFVSRQNRRIAARAIFSRCHLAAFSLPPQLRGHRYAEIQNMQPAVTKHLYSIPQSAFQDCNKDLQKRWMLCTDAGGSYFEDDP